MVPSGRTRDNRHKLKCDKFYLNKRRNFFTDDQTQKEVAQNGSGVVILGDTQNPKENNPSLSNRCGSGDLQINLEMEVIWTR